MMLQVNDTLACLTTMIPSEDELLAAINDEDYGEHFLKYSLAQLVI